MFEKLMVCLSRPKAIAMYLFEKKSRSILMLILFSLIAILPGSLKLFTNSEIDNYDEAYLEEVFMQSNLDFPLEIKDGVLSGREEIPVAVNNFVLHINPLNQKLDYGNASYLKSLPVIEFMTTGVKITFFGKVLKTFTYEDLDINNLDFQKIMHVDYREFNRFVNALNESYASINIMVAVSKTFMLLLGALSMVLLMALLLGFVSKLFNPLLIFRVRFKVAVDCQYIFLLTILFAGLFSQEWLIYVGSFLSCVYLFHALRQIVRFEIKSK